MRIYEKIILGIYGFLISMLFLTGWDFGAIKPEPITSSIPPAVNSIRELSQTLTDSETAKYDLQVLMDNVISYIPEHVVLDIYDPESAFMDLFSCGNNMYYSPSTLSVQLDSRMVDTKSIFQSIYSNWSVKQGWEINWSDAPEGFLELRHESELGVFLSTSGQGSMMTISGFSACFTSSEPLESYNNHSELFSGSFENLI